MAEIERKFRLAASPPADVLREAASIAQGYLAVSPGELRVRRMDGVCYLTIKSDGGLRREEWEVEIPPWAFETLWPATAQRRIEKTRFNIEHEGRRLEVDVYDGKLAGLLVLECEFSSEAEAASFRLPEWASSATEVTAIRAYKNKALAVDGWPPAEESRARRD